MLSVSPGWGGGGGTPHLKGVGMVVGNLELNRSVPIWAWPKLFWTPKRDHF